MSFDFQDKAVTLSILFLIILNLVFAISGCGIVQRTGNAIFNSKPDNEIIPDTPKKQLWQTIKGMTPNWLAIPVIALGAVAMFNGAAKLGMSCIIFGSVNLFMALATSRFGFWMAVCGLIGSVAAVAASMLAKNKALKEIIFGVQDIKYAAKIDKNVDPVFQGYINETLSKQVKSTKKIVAKIKSKVKLKGEF